MNKLFKRAALAALCTVAATSAIAQNPPAGSAPAAAPMVPASAARQVATAPSTSSAGIGYRSAFEGYARFDDQPVGSWKAANDNVGRIGGWRVYAKEATAPESAQGGSQAAPAGPSTAPGVAPSTAAPRPAPAAAPAPAGDKPAQHKNH